MVEMILGTGVEARKIGGGSLDGTVQVGHPSSAGIFTNGYAAIGMEQGIILSSGKATDFVGENNGNKSTSFSRPGDTSLDTLGGGSLSFDASILQFEFKLPDSTADKVQFKFVLASEEYPEFISSFYDIMGLFINGVNVALVPNTDPSLPVSIGNINHLKNASFYRSNSGSGVTYPMSYDGLTTILTAESPIIPGTWNSIKLAIADWQDRGVDSSLFIKSASLQQSAPTFSVTFNSNGGSTVSEQTVFIDNKATKPANPTRKDYVFVDWYTDESMTTKYDFNTLVTSDLMLYAKWTQPIPTAPTILTASNITQTSVQLSWNASTDDVGVTEYEVYRNGTYLLTVPGVGGNPPPTTTLVNGLLSGTLYTFYVRGKDADNNLSKASNTVSVNTLKPPDTLAPNVPFQVAASGISATAFRLNWKAPKDNPDPGGTGVSSYEIVLMDASNNTLRTVTVHFPSVSHSFSGLTPETQYKVKIRAADHANNRSIYSSDLNVRTTRDNTKPSKPTSLNHSIISDKCFTLSWNPSTDNVAVNGYKISRRNPVTKRDVQVGTSATPSFQYCHADPNLIHMMSVVAYDNANKESDASSPLYPANTYTDSVPPTIPTNLVAYNITAKSFTLSWDPATDDKKLGGYDVYLNDSKVRTIHCVSDNPCETEIELTGLSFITTYSIKVVAFDSAFPVNSSDFSEPLEVTTLDDLEPPTDPTNLIADNITDTNFFLSWDPSIDNVDLDHYEIYQDGRLIEDNIKTTTYIVSGLTGNRNYKMSVIAVDKKGNKSNVSIELPVTTPDIGAPGPGVKFNKMGAYADGRVTIQYWLYDRAIINIQLLDLSQKVVASAPLPSTPLTKSANRNAVILLPTKGPNSIPDGDYFIRLIASDKLTGNKTTLYRTLRVDHTVPTVTNFAVPSIGATNMNSTISFTLSEDSRVNLHVKNANDKIVHYMLQNTILRKGPVQFKWDGKNSKNQDFLDDTYTVELMVYDFVNLNPPFQTQPILIDRYQPTLKMNSIRPEATSIEPFRANGSRKLNFRFHTTERANVTLKIFDANDNLVRTVPLTTPISVNGVKMVSQGLNTAVWDGRNDANVLVSSGTYTYKLEATDAVGKVALPVTGTLIVRR